MSKKAQVIWLTGLSGAGKTTIAKALTKQLISQNINPILLDGDELRSLFQRNGFDEASRKQHNLEVGQMAAFFEKQGHIVIVSLISPYADIRDKIRNICHKFVEIHVATSLNKCIERDTKGLYKKAMAGELKEFTGISSPYQPPTMPEIVLDTEILSIEECVKLILEKT